MKVNIKLISTAFAFVFSAPAMAGFIDFESDTQGSVANGFTSRSDAGVHFSDTLGAGLRVHGHQALGSNNLLVFGDDASKLKIDFDFAIASLSLFFGNDDPGWSRPGDRAWLEIFDGGRSLGRTSVVMNRNDRTDQSISASAARFDSALFWYGNGGGQAINLIEAVDNISYRNAVAVPEPASIALVGLGLAAFGFARRSASA